jgi:uncharacterized protein YcfJ
LPGDVLPAKGLIDLNCETEKICITSKVFGKGNCENFGKDYKTVRIFGDSEKKKEKIKAFLAREMASCWELMQEGKFQIFSREYEMFSNTFQKAIVCSRIDFDGTVKVDSIENFNYYLSTHKAPKQNRSYLDYFRNSPEGDTIGALYGGLTGEKNGEDKLDLNEEKAIIFMESTLSNAGRIWGGMTGAVAGLTVSYFTGGAGLAPITTAGTYFGAGIGNGVSQDMSDFPGDSTFVSSIFLLNYNSENIQNLKLDSIESKV